MGHVLGWLAARQAAGSAISQRSPRACSSCSRAGGRLMPCSRLAALEQRAAPPGQAGGVAAAGLVALDPLRHAVGEQVVGHEAPRLDHPEECALAAHGAGGRAGGWPSGSSDAAVAASAPARHSTIIAMPMPLCPPMGSSAPSSACLRVGGRAASAIERPAFGDVAAVACGEQDVATRGHAAGDVEDDRRFARRGAGEGDRVVADGRAREAFHRQQRRRALADQAEVARLRPPARHACRARRGGRTTGSPPARWRDVSSACDAEPHGVRRRRYGPSRRRRRARRRRRSCDGAGSARGLNSLASRRSTYDGRRVRPCVA